MPLVLRNVKGAELTWTELDNNFTFLENEISNAISTIAGADVVRVATQSFTPQQQLQGRVNIGAASQDDVTDIDGRLTDIEAYNFVLYNAQSPTAQQQQTARNNIGAMPVLTKGIFEHVLTANDVANAIMTFTLQHTPNMLEWDFLFIGSGPVSPSSYTVSGNILSVDTSTIGYPMQAGRVLMFRYKY